MNGNETNHGFAEANNTNLNALIQQLAEKDKLIIALQNQISELTKQLADQSTQLAEISANITSLHSKGSKRSLKDADISPRPSTHKNRRTSNTNITTYFTSLDGTAETRGSLPNLTQVGTHGPASNLNQYSASQLSDAASVETMDTTGADAGVIPTNIQPQTHQSFAAVAALKTAPKPIKAMHIQLDVLDPDSAARVYELLQSSLPNGGFEWVQFRSESAPKIIPSSLDTKKRISKVLSDNNIQHSSFAEKGTQRQSFIVRGLNFGSDNHNISLINASLGSMGFTGDLEIQRYLTGHMKRNETARNALYVSRLMPTKTLLAFQPSRTLMVFEFKSKKWRNPL